MQELNKIKYLKESDILKRPIGISKLSVTLKI